MASGDLLRTLFKSYSSGDDASMRKAIEAIIQEERSKNHRLLADDLERIAFNGDASLRRLPDYQETRNLPKDRETGLDLLEVSEHDLPFQRLIASPRTLSPLEQVADEYNRRDLLATYGLHPTRTILFYGPPGCGKTLAAKVMASALYLPLVTIRLDSLISSFLGQTASNLRIIFDYLQQGRWVVFIDEFDAIAKDRDNPYEHGELKRVVNNLLQLMDGYRGDSLFIAATNHESLLDSAIWRRFESVVSFPLPSKQDRVLMLSMFLRSFDHSHINMDAIARRLDGASGADIELVAISSARRAVLSGRRSIMAEDIEHALGTVKERMALSGAITG